MDQPAQPQDTAVPPVQDTPQEAPPLEEGGQTGVPPGEAPPSDVPPESPPPQFPGEISPLKKFLPFILGGLFLFILILGSVLLFAGNSSQKGAPTPTPRPSATPFAVPTVAVTATLTPQASPSATLTPVQTGRLIFIQDGDIYNSDFRATSLFIKPPIPAGSLLSWSTTGKFLSWLSRQSSSQLLVYNREKKDYDNFAVSPPSTIAGYSWSPSTDDLVLLSKGTTYELSMYQVSSKSAQPKSLLKRSAPITQAEWVKDDMLLIRGSDGMSTVSLSSPSANLVAAKTNISYLRVSPDKTRIIYAVGDDTKSDLYIAGIDASSSRLLAVKPTTVDMGTTNLPSSTLEKGFLPYAVWFPKGNKLLVAYHYLTHLPLVGVYDVEKNSVQMIAPFALARDDVMVDDFRLLGVRNNPLQTGTTQLTLYTIEDSAKLNVVRVIPGASSPAVFEKGLP